MDAARRRGGGAALELPAVHPRGRRARRARRRQRASSSSPRPRPCWSAGTWRRRCGTPASRARCWPVPAVSRRRRGPGARSPTRGWTRSSSPARRRRRGGSSRWRPGPRAVRRDERQERDHRHRARRPRPGHSRSRPLGLRPRRPEVLGGEPRHLRGRGVRRPRVPPPAPRRRGEPRPSGSAWDAWSRITPLTQPPGEALARARSPRSTPARSGCSSRAPRRRGRPALVAGHQARRAPRLVLPPDRVLRPRPRADAGGGSRRGHRRSPTTRPFGLTSGIQSLDDREVDRWVDRIEAGNLYVNRPITGRHRRAAALRRLEGLVGGPGRQGGRAQLRAAARPLAAGGAARRGCGVRTAGGGGARALPRRGGRRRPGGGGAAGERGQLRRGLARALRARARPERAPRRGQRASATARAARSSPAATPRRARRRSRSCRRSSPPSPRGCPSC